MKGAIIGFGKIGVGHLEGYNRCNGLSITSIVDISDLRRKIAKKKFGLNAYATFEELIESEDLDFIDVCTPPSSHAFYSAKSLDNNFHTLCEKPVFIRDSSGYESQISKIESSNKLFYPCHVYKFSPMLLEVKKIIKNGIIGDVVGADFKTLRIGHAIGTDGWDPDWRRKTEVSEGGILRDHGPHSIYTAMHLTNSVPKSVSCISGNIDKKFNENEDTCFVRMNCTNDIKISFTLTWSSSIRNTSYSVLGTKGSIFVENDEVTYTSDNKLHKKVMNSGFDDPSHKAWFKDMFSQFVDFVDHPEKIEPIITEALVTAATLDSAYKSASMSGKWVDLSIPKYPTKQ